MKRFISQDAMKRRNGKEERIGETETGRNGEKDSPLHHFYFLISHLSAFSIMQTICAIIWL